MKLSRQLMVMLQEGDKDLDLTQSEPLPRDEQDMRSQFKEMKEFHAYFRDSLVEDLKQRVEEDVKGIRQRGAPNQTIRR